jgi:hypothetical protein
MDNIYDESGRRELCESDAIDDLEEGFMNGYMN